MKHGGWAYRGPVPEQPNQASLQRRANWVGVRTLRQRPKLVGATTDGEPVYEIRSVRIVLRGLSPHFNRLAPCSRCGKDMAGAPVLTSADLERPLRPMICTDCVRGTGVSTVWDPATPRPPAADSKEEEKEPPAEPVATPAHDDGRLDLFEGHLRAVTERVNALGKSVWAQRTDGEERRREAEAARSLVARLGEQVAALAGVGDRVDGQRAELAAVVSAITELRSELQRLSDGNRALVRSNDELERRLAEVSAAAAPEPDVTRAELAAVVAAHDQLEQRVAAAEVRPLDVSQLDGHIASRLEEVERRLSDQLMARWGDLETAIEKSVAVHGAKFVRAHEELADAQAGILQRLDQVAGQVAQLTRRVEAMASWMGSTTERLDALEDRAERVLLATAPRLEVPGWQALRDPSDAPTGGLLETLERQLQDAASRLAARTERTPVD
jgi:regulator of replication initiation timing